MLIVKYIRKSLEKCYRNKNETSKKWGSIVGEKYVKQLSLVYAAETIDDLYLIPQLHFHPLKGNREGQHAITLTNRARLIVECKGNLIIIIREVSTRHYE